MTSPVRTSRWQLWDRITAVAIGAMFGFVIGIAGAFVIRYGGASHAGLVLALVTFFLGAVFARSLAGPWAFVPLVVGTALAVAATAFATSGADIVLPFDTTSTVWVLGVAVLANVVAFLPRRWFDLRQPRVQPDDGASQADPAPFADPAPPADPAPLADPAPPADPAPLAGADPQQAPDGDDSAEGEPTSSSPESADGDESAAVGSEMTDPQGDTRV